MITKIKQLFKKRMTVILVASAVVIILVFLLFFNKDELAPEPAFPGQQNPAPVVIVAPKIDFIEAIPPQGLHETYDIYEQIFFKFSSDINQNLVRVSVSPSAQIKTTVYEGQKDTVVVEPTGSPWKENTEYTISINPGVMGTNGEELNQKVEYRFTLKQPEVFEGGDPIRPVK